MGVLVSVWVWVRRRKRREEEEEEAEDADRSTEPKRTTPHKDVRGKKMYHNILKT